MITTETANLFNQLQKYKTFLCSCSGQKSVPWLFNIITENIFKIERGEDPNIDQLETIKNYLLKHTDDFAVETISIIEEYIRRNSRRPS